MGIKSISLAVTTLVLSTNLNATLIGVNDSNLSFLGASEDGFNITLDTSTNLEWLDWSLTLSRSYNDVFAQTQGGDLDGWRYATAAEFESLALSAGIPASFIDLTPIDFITHPSFEVLNTFLGSGSVDNESIAISSLPGSTGHHELGGFSSGQLTFDVPGGPPISVGEFLDFDVNSRVGSALVRVSAVPIPAAAWLFGSGIIGLVGMARRKAHA